MVRTDRDSSKRAGAQGTLGRSAATVFAASLLLGVIAFGITLVVGPAPDEYRPPSFTPEQREAARRQERFGRDRQRVLTEGDWTAVRDLATFVLETSPEHLWARIDLMHAMTALGEEAGAVRAQASLLEGHARGVLAQSPDSRWAWQAHAALGWALRFAGDEAGASSAFGEAARACEQLLTLGSGLPSNGAYNAAGYWAQAGDLDRALAQWELAVDLAMDRGEIDPAYARADYDLAPLVGLARFEAGAQRLAQRRAELEREREARAERQRVEQERALREAAEQDSGVGEPAEPADPAEPGGGGDGP